MLGSRKNSSSVKIPNFLQQNLKMLGIKFCFDRKMRPSMESHPSILLLMDCEEIEKVISHSFCRYIMSSSQVSSDTMLYFYHSSYH